MVSRADSEPCATDAPNARIDYFGFGIDLKTERPTPAKIAKGVTRVLGDKRVAQNVERIRAELETYQTAE